MNKKHIRAEEAGNNLLLDRPAIVILNDPYDKSVAPMNMFKKQVIVVGIHN